MSRSENWSELITTFRSNRNLTQANFADNMKVTQQTVSRWESGKQQPDPPSVLQLRAIVGSTTIATKDAWCKRVELSWGMEALFDKGWRYLAISQKLQALSPQPVGAAPDRHLSDISELKDAAAIMARLPFFTGGIRLMRARISLSWHDMHFVGDVEMWPILTSADEIIAHIVVNSNSALPTEPVRPGIHIFQFDSVLIDGTILGAPDEVHRA